MNSGCTLWFTGLSGSGKSTLSQLLASRLRELGARVEVLDGDIIRTQLCRGLGFTREDREENIRRIGFVCELLSRNGVIAIVAAISPYRACRDELRERITNFVEIYMHCPLDVLIQRDVKGLYKKALSGEIAQFTGISDVDHPGGGYRAFNGPGQPTRTCNRGDDAARVGVYLRNMTPIPEGLKKEMIR
jgi:adenylyl-sulfate kinase